MAKNNWSDLAKQFLDKMRPSGAPSQGESSSGDALAPKPEPSRPAEQPPEKKSSGGSKESQVVVAESGGAVVTDIGRQKIGDVYGQALLRAAGENVGPLLDELQAFSKLVDDSDRLGEVLGSPRVSAKEKIGILDRSLKGRVSPLLLNFLKVVTEHERLDCLREIYREARRLQNEVQGVVEVVVTTAHALDASELRRLGAALQEKTGSGIEIRVKVDPALIGGILIRIGDHVFDASVSQRLAFLREDAIRNAVQSMRAATKTYAID